MPFPSTKRFKFHNNPLVEVVCQFSFASPVDAGVFTDENFVALHNEIKANFPQFKKGKSLSIKVETEKNSVIQEESVVYEFSSLDEKVKIITHHSSLSIVTTNYESREIFFGYVESVFEKMNKMKLTGVIDRVGLRFKDIISRDSLEGISKNTCWSELLNEPLIPFLSSEDDISSNILGMESKFLIKLDEINENAKMSTIFASVTNAETSEPCFIIDSDFYNDGEIEYEAAKQFLYGANRKSRDFFQWCLKPKLFQLLKPEEVAD
jgi:uncharacterized protein (TIGR04255 family)